MLAAVQGWLCVDSPLPAEIGPRQPKVSGLGRDWGGCLGFRGEFRFRVSLEGPRQPDVGISVVRIGFGGGGYFQIKKL